MFLAGEGAITARELHLRLARFLLFVLLEDGPVWIVAGFSILRCLAWLLLFALSLPSAYPRPVMPIAIIHSFNVTLAE